MKSLYTFGKSVRLRVDLQLLRQAQKCWAGQWRRLQLVLF